MSNFVKPSPGNDRAPPSLLDRFRALLKQREEVARFSAEDDDAALSSEEIVQLYELLLDELTFNSKPVITDLTIIAGELRDHGEGIADAICARIVEAPVEHKLPSLYLLDSIVKNIGREYAAYFSSRLPEVFCLAYKQVHPNLHPSMRHLFGTWSSVFPRSVLDKIATQLQFSPQGSSQPSSLSSLKSTHSPRPAHGIHVNPKYVRQMEQSTSDNNAQHVRGASPTMKIFSQKNAVGNDEYDSDHADITSTQVGSHRINALGNMGNTSFALGANRLHQSSSSRLARHLSPSTVGAERPLISEVEDLATGNSPQRFGDGTNPLHPLFDYGPIRSVGRDEEINDWRRKHYPDDNHKRFEASMAYNLPNGHGRQGPRALIDAYGEDERNKIPNSKSLLVDQLDSDGLVNKVAPLSWQNTEEEEFDWEDMSPTLADRSRSIGFATATATAPAPPFRGPGVRPNFLTSGVSRLEADGRTSQSGHAQLSLMDDSSNIAEDAVSIPGSARQNERNQITGSHYPRDSWKLPPHFPNPAERSQEFQLPFHRSGVSSSGIEGLAFPVEKLPEMDDQLTRPTSHPLRVSSSGAPSSMGAWPIVNVHKSHPPPMHPNLPPQKQSRIQYDPRITSNLAGNQGSQNSLISDQQLSSLESKEPSLMKPSLVPGLLAGMNQQNQAQVNPFQPQFLPSNGPRENFSAMTSLPPHPLLPPFDRGYGIQSHGMGISMVPSNPMHSVRHPLPVNFPNSFRPQGGMRPPFPPGLPPASQMIPFPHNTGPFVANQAPGNAFSGLISSLMSQGLISLTNEASVQDSVVLDFNNPDLYKVRYESAISAFYCDLPRQCTTCGLRFKSQEEHSSHMDWHVTKNRMSKNRKQNPSRKWFVSASMWLIGQEASGTDSVPGFLPVETAVEQKDDEELAVPADEDQNACALCGEPFDDFYSDETEEWMYRGAMYLNAPDGSTAGMDRSQLGPIVHAKCRSGSSTVLPDDL